MKIVLGEMSVEVLKSTTVSSSRALREGFVFRYPAIGDAVKKISAPEQGA
jgi:NAD dependent epimerase/dehydratase family enzyme